MSVARAGDTEGRRLALSGKVQKHMRVLIVRNNANPQAIDASLLLATYLATQNLQYALVDSSDLERRQASKAVDSVLAEGIDLAVALGGDGTILRTAHCVGTSGVPILGINFGRLGFLANASDKGVVAVVADALAGDVVAERRTNLRIDIVCEGDSDPFEEVQTAHVGECGLVGERDVAGADVGADSSLPAAAHSFFALNEVAVTRGASGRIIDFSLGVSGARIADMRGDGLVVATATGSTAYALSAGGPLVAPGFGGLVAVPLAPHTLHSRAIVTAENDVVEMGLAPTAAPATGSAIGSVLADCEASVFVDGELVELDRPVRRVYVRRGSAPTVLLRHTCESFYEHAAKVFF